MRKSLLLVMIGLLILSMSGNVWAGNVVAADLVCTNPAGCVQTDEIIDGAVTNSKIATGAVTTTNIAGGAITTATIANGAVTDMQISGTISGSKLGSHTHNGADITDGTIGTSKISDGTVTNAKLADWAVTGTKIADYSVTDTKISSNAVTTSKVADGAITDAKIAGPISTSKLEKAANVVVVAKAGGDFTNIAAAMAAINPTADNPYVIKVMPGIYQVSWDWVNKWGAGIVMKSYVHLQGTGRDVTTIEGVGVVNSTIGCESVTHATISGFTFKGSKFGGYETIKAIMVSDSSYITIEDNNFVGPLAPAIVDTDPASTTIVRGNRFTNLTFQEWGMTGIMMGGNAIYTNNIFEGNGWTALAIYNGSPVIRGNLFTANGYAVSVLGGTPTIKDNVMTGNWRGLSFGGGIAMNNKITGSSSCDVNAGSSAILSYNIFDTLCPGSSYIGKYNLKSDGTDAPTAP